jgi:DNA-binding XRE family transcriptional regulator
MPVRMKTRLTNATAKSGKKKKAAGKRAVILSKRGAFVRLDSNSGGEVWQIPHAAVERVRSFMTELFRGVSSEVTVEGESALVPADEVFADLYAKTTKPATVLRGLRIRDELTQAELAKMLGTEQSNIAKMETGTRSIGKDMAKRLAEIFKTDYRVFL